MKKLCAFLSLVTSCTIYNMDNEPQKPQQDWTSKKELTKNYGYHAAQFLENVSATQPDKIKDLKASRKTILRTTGAIYEKPLDEIFTVDQWTALESANVLPIIDKYRKDKLSTWLPVNTNTEKTTQNAKREKRVYILPVPNQKRYLSTVLPTQDNEGLVTIMQETDFLVDGIKATTPLQLITLPSNAAEVLVTNQKNGKLVTLSYNDVSGNKKIENWKAQRNSKIFPFNVYLKEEIANKVKFTNVYNIKYTKGGDGELYNQGLKVIEFLKQYSIPLEALLEASANPSPDAFSTIVQQHVPAHEMQSFNEGFKQLAETQMNVTQENQEERLAQTTKTQSQVLKKTFTHSYKQTHGKTQNN